MVGNITVGIVVLLIVGGIIFGCRIDHQAIQKMLDKLAKRNIIHKNKASNLKSKLAAHISKLA